MMLGRLFYFVRKGILMERKNYSSGAPLEEKVGYSRMVRAGGFVMIRDTTSVQPDGTVYGEGSPYDQARYIFEKQIGLLAEAGAGPEDVIQVKAYLTHMADASEVSRAYSEIFHNIRPLFTAIGTTELNRPAQLCEIEMMAVLQEA